jgi:ELWxxDGT repeat protein
MPSPFRSLTQLLTELFFPTLSDSSRRRLVARNIFGQTEDVLECRMLLSARAVVVEDLLPGGGLNNSTISDSSPENLIDVSGTLYFTANDDISGRELWRINQSGVAEIVEDAVPGGGLRPGAGSSNPGPLVNVDGTLFFTADDGTNGTELWRINTAGTAELVENALPGGGLAPGFRSANAEWLTNVDGTLYFSADDQSNGKELWRVGKTGIAQMIEDAVPGGGISDGSDDASPSQLTNVSGQLFFVASNREFGMTLWRIDTAGQATLAEDAIPDGGISGGVDQSARVYPDDLVNLNGVLYFTAYGSTTGRELWRTGTTGTLERVEDSVPGGGINPGIASSNPDCLTLVNNTVYFTAFDDNNGRELWRINSQGRAEMVDAAASGAGIYPGSGSAVFQDFVRSDAGGAIIRETALCNVNGTLYFVARDSDSRLALWRMNAAGRAEVVNRVSVPAGSDPSETTFYPHLHSLTNIGGTLFFVASGSMGNHALWRVNQQGVAVPVESPLPRLPLPYTTGVTPQLILNCRELTNVGGILYFTVRDDRNGFTLWSAEPSGTARMLSGARTGSRPLQPAPEQSRRPPVLSGNSVYFPANDGLSGQELWKADPNGIVTLVEDSRPGGGLNTASGDTNFFQMKVLGNSLYFGAYNGEDENLPTPDFNGFRVDRNGLIVDNYQHSLSTFGGLGDESRPLTLNDSNRTTYFAFMVWLPQEFRYVRQLWRSVNGGPGRLVTLDASLTGSTSNILMNIVQDPELTEVNGTVYFRAFRNSTTEAIWRVNSQGRAEIVTDTADGPGGPAISAPVYQSLINVSGTLYFTALNDSQTRELWRIQGNGIPERVPHHTGSAGSVSAPDLQSVNNLTNVNGTLYFTASEAPNSELLWRINSHGIAEAVQPAVTVPDSSVTGLTAAQLTNVNGILYFTSWSFPLGRINSAGFAEAVPTESSPATGNSPNPSFTRAHGLTAAGSTLYFSAFDPVNGVELWRVNSRGAAEIIDDRRPGAGIGPGERDAFDTLHAINVNGTLYFVADDAVNGRELWSVSTAGVAEIVDDNVPGEGLNPGSGDAIDPNPRLINVNGTLYFVADDGIANGRELWKIETVASPVLQMPAHPVTYIEAQNAVILSPTATISDSDSVNFARGRLIVSITGNSSPLDRLSVRHTGFGPNQIGWIKNTVRYGGLTIGTFGGSTQLTVDLNSRATPAAVQALVRSIQFRSLSKNPATGNRVVKFVVTDGRGGISQPRAISVMIEGRNDSPALSRLRPDLTWAVTSPAVPLYREMILKDPDSQNFNGGTITVTMTRHREQTDRIEIRHTGFGPEEIGWTGNTVRYGGVTIGTFSGTSNLTIALNHRATRDAVQELLRSLTYRSQTLTPVTLSRSIRLQMTDGDGGVSNTVDTTIRIVPLSELPAITVSGGSTFWKVGSSAVAADPGILFNAPAFRDFRHSVIHVELSRNSSIHDRLGIRHEGFGDNQIGWTTDRIFFGGVNIGWFSGTRSLTLALNQRATSAAVQALLRSITFDSSDSQPTTLTRTFTFTLTTENGLRSNTASRNIVIEPS